MKLAAMYGWWLLGLVAGHTSRESNKTASLESEPNPIALQYPNSVTGTINGTMVVVPIPYSLARSIIPAQWGIITAAYESLLPDFPKNHYPLIIRGSVDHDILVGALNLGIPDFQTVRIAYPFIDLLNDGYSSFLWQKYLFVTSTNEVAINATEEYGQIPIPSHFDPFLEAYKFVGDEECEEDKKEIFFNAYTNISESPAVTTRFRSLPNMPLLYPLDFFKNVTNQPGFGSGISCDNMITYFNTTLSTAANATVAIKGKIEVKKPYLPVHSVFENVHGIKLDIAFLENNFIPCEELKGYVGEEG